MNKIGVKQEQYNVDGGGGGAICNNRKRSVVTGRD